MTHWRDALRCGCLLVAFAACVMTGLVALWLALMLVNDRL